MAKDISKSAYLIGIKGVGMTSLALYLQQAGYEVSGSDTEENFLTDEILSLENIPIFEGFNEGNLHDKKPDLVIASAAYGQTNPEVKIAKKKHLNFIYYSEALGQISSDKKVIAVAGIHGKTTITAMISFILEKAGMSPSFIIGASKLPGLKNIAQKGEGEYFVIEADEYRKSPEDKSSKFLDLSPQIAIISSIELDHPDLFASVEEVYNAFYALACRVPRNGFIVTCLDYPKVKKLRRSLVDRDIETYGFDLSAQWKIVNVKETPTEVSFSLNNMGKLFGPYILKVPGEYNILNATATIITVRKLGIQEKTIKKYLNQFKGVQRRFEEKAKVGNIVIIDDYAHHPTAIRSTLEAAKKKYLESKIYCIFQPHTFSRTATLLNEFSKAFKNADRVIITDIFGSAREEKGKVSGADLAAEIKKNQTGVRFISDWKEILAYLEDVVEPPAAIIIMGAGNIYKIAKDIENIFRAKEDQNG